MKLSTEEANLPFLPLATILFCISVTLLKNKDFCSEEIERGEQLKKKNTEMGRGTVATSKRNEIKGASDVRKMLSADKYRKNIKQRNRYQQLLLFS